MTASSYSYDVATAEDSEKPPPPTLNQITVLWEWTRRYNDALKRQQDEDHDYYNLKIRIQKTEGYDLVLPPTGRTVVNDAADHIANADPSFATPRAKQTENAERQAEKLDKWMDACWKRLNENVAQPLHRKACIHALSKGMMALYIRYLPERIPKQPKGWPSVSPEVRANYEARQRLSFPFVWTLHDPRYVYADPGTNGETWVIEHFWKRVGDVRAEFPEWQGWKDDQGGAKDDNEQVEFLAYFDRYYRAYIANWQFVSYVKGEEPGPVEHGMGFTPWVIRSAGTSDDGGMPDEKFQSMLYVIRGLLDEEARVMSQGQAIIRDTAWPWMVTPAGARVEPSSRKISQVPPDLVDKLKQFRPDADSPKAVVEWLGIIRDSIEGATYSQVVTGHAPSGQRSGFSIAVLAGMARVKFGPIKFNVESLLAEAMQKTLLLIENKVRAPIKVWLGGDTDFEIGPRDIRGYERVNCTIEANLLQDRAADADIGAKGYELGMSLETVLQDYFHIKEPLDEIDRRHAEDFLKNPAIQMMMLLDAAKRRGMDPTLIQIAMQALGLGSGGGASGQVQPGGQSSPGGTPPAPAGGMEGTRTPGPPAPPVPGTTRPSIPGSGPTSPMGPGGAEALRQVGMLPGELGRATQLGSVGVNLGGEMG